ncbi:AAA family ATPase [uncultured Roseovarius sp.]|uniref:AAA family ATPase n=1 Tax=uncultured Roseovarius sp. TaxID=293344 RepID=UPI0026314B53|nr:AAA family ATPase [uncultured Roseovarius sp.]
MRTTAAFDDGAPMPPLEAYQTEVQPTAPRRSSVFFVASKLEGQPTPERRWLVEGLIPSGTVTLLGGDGGTGKSLVALQLAASTALSRAWLGLPVTSGRALYISAEDDRDELHRRLSDIARAEGVALAGLDNLTVRSLAGEDALLATAEKSGGVLRPSSLYYEIDRRMKDEAPALLVLDTLADLFPGNENDRAQARQFVGMLRGLSIRHECAVVMLAHPSLSGLNSGSGMSGSTGWNNSVRSRLYLERVKDDGYEADPDARILRTMKANYSRTGGEISLRWQGGVFVAQAPETGLDRMAATAKAERVFLKLLKQAQDQGRKVNHAGGQTHAPKVFATNPQAEGITKRNFGQAMEKLLAAGKIRIAEYGPPSKRRQFLEVAE